MAADNAAGQPPGNATGNATGKATGQLALSMKIWTASAIRRYYLDPAIQFFRAGDGDIGGPSMRGYYILPHDRPERGDDFAHVALADLGPFATSGEAGKWSRKNLVEPESSARRALPRSAVK
jgi:hypothetical protein